MQNYYAKVPRTEMHNTYFTSVQETEVRGCKYLRFFRFVMPEIVTIKSPLAVKS